MLAGSIAHVALPGATDATLHQLDSNLAHLSPELLKLTLQLFDVLAMPVTRGPLTGVWDRWEDTSPERIQHFCSAGKTAASTCCAWAMAR